MPRKPKNPRKGNKSPVSLDSQRRAVRVTQSRKPKGLDRYRRTDVRPPKFPGRLGGR